MATYGYFSKYLLLCYAEERNSYKFETTSEWVNDGCIFKTQGLIESVQNSKCGIVSNNFRWKDFLYCHIPEGKCFETMLMFLYSHALSAGPWFLWVMSHSTNLFNNTNSFRNETPLLCIARLIMPDLFGSVFCCRDENRQAGLMVNILFKCK